MNLTVIVERISDDRFRAAISQPFQIESEGPTRDEAIERVRKLAVNRLGSAELVEINIPDEEIPHPWARWMGVWKDNPQIDDYLANIQEYRRNADASLDFEEGA